MEKYFFKSEKLNKTVEYKVIKLNEHIKDAYLLYVQDGNDYLELGQFEKTVHQLQNELQINKQLIFVMIHPGDSNERWNSYHPLGEFFHRYIEFMTNEFIPSFESNLPGVNIEKRGLIGDSLAANISLNIACSTPSLWTHLLLQSAAVSKADIARVENCNQLDWNIYQFVGTLEDEFVSPITNDKLFIYTRNLELQNVLRTKGVNLFYKEEEVQHLWVVWKRDLPNVLRFFLEN